LADAQTVKRGFLPAFIKGAANPTGFSVGFKEGLIGGFVLFIIMIGWMFLRSTDTAYKIQELLPAKSAVIEDPTAPRAPEEQEKEKVSQEGQEGLAGPKDVAALAAAPIEGLSETVDGKTLPVIRTQDEMTPFLAYRKPFEFVAGRALVSVVVVDFGLSESMSKSALENMPAEVSFVLSTYADEPTQWAASSRAYGHEFWLSLPMQSVEFGTGDNGPNTLLVNASPEENQARLFNVLGSVTGYAGLVSQEGHAFPQDAASAAPILKQIYDRGLAFAESNPDVAAFGLSTAMENGNPYVQNTFWIDQDLRPEAIDQKFKDLEAQATKKGKAVAFVHPYPVVMTKLQAWLKDVEQKGLQVAPLSAMVQ